MASSIPSSTFEKYPFPIEIKVKDIFSFKLSRENYLRWKRLMLGLIESQGLLGFINNEVAAPPKRVTVPDDDDGPNGDDDDDDDGPNGDDNDDDDDDDDGPNGDDDDDDDDGPNGTMEIENPDHRAWERTDALLQSWILGTVNEDFLPHLVSLETVKDMWTMLESLLTEEAPLVPNTEEAPVMKKNNNNNNLSKYLPLYKAAIRGDWESAEEFLKNEPDAVRTGITKCLETALMVAIRSVSGNHFVKKLLERMSADDVALVDTGGSTALHIAASCGNTEAAKLLVDKNPHLPNVGDNSNILPIHDAALVGQRRMIRYLWLVTKPLEDNGGATLIDRLICSKQFDIALLLIKTYPWTYLQSSQPLYKIALKKSAFRSGVHLNLWQQLIYSYAPLKSEDSAYQSSGGDIENPVNSFVSFPGAYDVVKQKLHYIFWKLTQMLVPQMKYIQQIKWEHDQALELVKHLCEKVVKLEYSIAKDIFNASILKAAKVGIPEVVEEIFAVFPDAIWSRNLKGENVFHIAILNRHENVFNLIYQFHDKTRHLVIAFIDSSKNSSLDLVANLKTEQRVNLRASAAGAALQMQRELQWYKEVENFSFEDHKDSSDIKIVAPRMVFSETHEKLIKEGEEWMKDTANSCTIVAALIVTIVFAAAITVPGGNNSSNGHPIFLNNKAFITFGVSDALALYTSTTSLLVFLSMLTSRYAEEDFLEVLPKRLITSLITLFISIISMMIAFAATLYLVLGDRNPWIIAPITGLTCIPGFVFVSSQFPLLLDMIKFTYRIGIFCQQNDRILF